MARSVKNKNICRVIMIMFSRIYNDKNYDNLGISKSYGHCWMEDDI